MWKDEIKKYNLINKRIKKLKNKIKDIIKIKKKDTPKK